MINPGSTFPCPDCKHLLEDVRKTEDRIDFWCNTCRLPFSESQLHNPNPVATSNEAIFIDAFQEIKRACFRLQDAIIQIERLIK